MLKIPDPPGFAASPDPLLQGSTPPNERMHPTMPFPDPATGELKIDPEIQLKAKGFDLTVSMFYSAAKPEIGMMGIGRSASVFARLWDANGTIVTITRGDFGEQYYEPFVPEESGSGTVVTYVSSKNTGNVTSLTYDTEADEYTEHFLSGMKMVYQEPYGGPANARRLGRVVDPSGNAQTYSYATFTYWDGTGDEEFRALRTIEVPGGNKVSFTYTVVWGQPLVETIGDWSGREWTMRYDANACLTTFTTPLGCVTKYGYSLAGAGAANTMLHTLEDSRGYVATYMYNARRQVVSLAAGTGVWSYSYNTNQTVEYWPSGGRVTYAYGEAGNNVGTIRADGVPVTYSYNENRMKVKETTPAGTMMSVVYDAQNRLSLSDDPLGNRTTYGYDVHSNVTTIQYPDSGIATFGYEGDGSTRRLVRHTDPLGRVTSWTYTTDGLVRTSTDPRGLVTTNNYDSQGNVVSVAYSDGGVATMFYDLLNRMESSVDPINRRTTYTYDAADHVVAVRNPLNRVTTYLYDGCLLQAEVDALG
ncbi:RHS repeat protein, partial [bacterium]